MKEFFVNNYPLIPVIIDEEDWNRIEKYNWYRNSDGSIITRDGANLTLSRFILNITDLKIFVDHKNHNKLDNRKENLRLCDFQGNGANRLPNIGRKFKGVSKTKNNKWRAIIKYDNKSRHIGTYKTEEEAAKAYDKVAIVYFGEFACLNFPKEGTNDVER